MSERYDHVIVGGGVAAHAAAKAIHERDPEASVAVLGEEQVGPFYRPALSKDLWTDEEADVEGNRLDTAGETGATMLLGVRAIAVDTDAHTVTCDDGRTLDYGRLLVATGGHPRQLDGVPASDRVIYFRTLPDYERLRALAESKPRVAVVGGGFIGTEIAAALAQHGCRVTLVHPEEVLGQATYPARLAADLEQAFTDAEVELRGGALVQGVEEYDGGLRVRLDDGVALEADVVVLGLGIVPATGFLPESVERAADGSVRVGPDLRTTADDVWAAGDVAEYPDRILGRRRVEHVENAERMGEVAGHVMAGAEETYDHTPMFWSDLFDHWYEALGDLDASLTTVEDRRESGGVVVYYLDDEAVRGVLLWDCDGGSDEAREVLARRSRPQDPQELVGTIA